MCFCWLWVQPHVFLVKTKHLAGFDASPQRGRRRGLLQTPWALSPSAPLPLPPAPMGYPEARRGGRTGLAKTRPKHKQGGHPRHRQRRQSHVSWRLELWTGRNRFPSQSRGEGTCPVRHGRDEDESRRTVPKCVRGNSTGDGNRTEVWGRGRETNGLITPGPVISSGASLTPVMSHNKRRRDGTRPQP